MSVHAFPRLDRFPELTVLLPTYVGTPSAVSTTDTTLTLTFTPDLTAAQTSDLGRLVGYCRVSLNVSAAEWMALDSAISDLRAQRTRTDAAWTALTAAQRDTQLIAWCRDITDVLRAILRD